MCGLLVAHTQGGEDFTQPLRQGCPRPHSSFCSFLPDLYTSSLFSRHQPRLFHACLSALWGSIHIPPPKYLPSSCGRSTSWARPRAFVYEISEGTLACRFVVFFSETTSVLAPTVSFSMGLCGLEMQRRVFTFWIFAGSLAFPLLLCWRRQQMVVPRSLFPFHSCFALKPSAVCLPVISFPAWEALPYWPAL